MTGFCIFAEEMVCLEIAFKTTKVCLLSVEHVKV